MHRARIAALLALTPVLAFAHGGGLDRNGCHTNRKTGDYHCHNAASRPAPAPARAVPQPAVVTYVGTAAEPNDTLLIRTAQILLLDLGYKPTLLGTLDAPTRAAIKSFQSAQNLEADGTVSPALLLRLAHAVAGQCE